MCELIVRRKAVHAHLTPVLRSNFSNSSRSSWLQFLPMGDTLSMPLRNSTKVPRQAPRLSSQRPQPVCF
jgi:hypothetical protein